MRVAVPQAIGASGACEQDPSTATPAFAATTIRPSEIVASPEQHRPEKLPAGPHASRSIAALRQRAVDCSEPPKPSRHADGGAAARLVVLLEEMPLRLSKRLVRPAVRRWLMTLRKRYYVAGTGAWLVGLLSQRLRTRLGFEDEGARFARRIELGAGPHPNPGYLHVDIDPHAAHLEALAPAWLLPFPNDWATEILCIHALEHVQPRLLRQTLSEWRRVLGPGSIVRVHVPNSPALMQAYLAADTAREKWLLSGALLGQYCGPDTSGPADIQVPSDHQILFDRELLLGLLAEAGFVDLVDRTEQVIDRHTEAWRPIVDDYSIVLEARNPPTRA
jgi:predicted SAM-dependent methyltransferase